MPDVATTLQLTHIAAYIITMIIFIVMMKADIKILKHDIAVIKLRADSQSETLKSVSAALTTVAVQKNEIDHIQEDIRELRHGKGFITGEYNRHGVVKPK